MVCVTFKFVCFDGIERKKLADEVVREKKERKKKNKKRKRVVRKLECFGGSGREKRGKREKEKKREGYVCGGEKKREK